MTQHKFISKSLALAAMVCTASASQAALTVYTTQSSFLAAVTSPGTDTYTGFNISTPTASPITRTAGTYAYTAATSNLSPTSQGFFGGGTTLNPFLSTNYALDTITFSGFSGGASAIGGNFFGTNISGLYLAGSVTVTAFDASGNATRTIAPTSDTAGSFLGFVSTGPLTSLVVASVTPTPSGASLWPTVDNLTLAIGAVPEPGTYALMLAGLGLVGWVARRRA